MEDLYWSSIDLGSHSVICLIARPSIEEEDSFSFDKMEIVGIGVAKSEGMSKGTIVDLDRVRASIKQAVEDAELMAGLDIDNLFLGISGKDINSFNIEGGITISYTRGIGREITESDVDRVMELVRRKAESGIERYMDILHVIPIDYTIDGKTGIKDPVGMSGMELSARVHIIAAPKDMIGNTQRSVSHLGNGIRKLVAEHIAIPEAILREDEKEGGVVVLDIGGDLTNITVIKDSGIVFTKTIPIGGNNITKDLSFAFQIHPEPAEKIKINYGSAILDTIPLEDRIEVPQYGGKSPKLIKRRLVCEVINARVVEILEICKSEIEEAGLLKDLHAGVVVTGGTSMLSGVLELTEKIFALPVRLGAPLENKIKGIRIKDIVLSPQYSTAVGLLEYGKYFMLEGYDFVGEEDFFDKIKKRLKKIIDEIL